MQGGKVVVPLNSCRRPALLVAPGAHRSALLRTWSASGSRQRGGRCLPPLPETAPALDTGPGSDPDCVRFIRVALGSGLLVWKVGSSFLLLRGAMGDSAWHRPGPGGSLAHVVSKARLFFPEPSGHGIPGDPSAGPVALAPTPPALGWTRCPHCRMPPLLLRVWWCRVGHRKPGRAALSDGEKRTPQTEVAWAGPRAAAGWSGAGRAAPVVGWGVCDAPGLSSSGEHVALIE